MAPYALASTGIVTVISGQAWSLPWALALLVAVLGCGAALVPLGSLVAVQPLDTAGNPTPAWSLKIHIALLIVAIGAIPTLLALLAGRRWFAVPVTVCTAGGPALSLGVRAAASLGHDQLAILRIFVRGAS